MKRKSYAAAFKTRVAVEAIRGEQTISQIAARFEAHPSHVSLWKKQALQHLTEAFSTRRGKAKQQEDVRKDELQGQIGRLMVDLDWLRKTSAHSLEEKRRMVEPDHGQLSIERQCELLGLARSSVYYQPVGETSYNLQLMRVIDEVYTAHPMLGA